jgi:hypothetical protein
MTFINGEKLLQNHLNGDFDELETTFCKYYQKVQIDEHFTWASSSHQVGSI